ncbi:RHS repeat-associated core domain-containing protein [Candidatus Neptunichlamydia sp. REUL1]|uniref:RHS repeat-associated core domain-containing protein n=1 Tax=Candidatus Neptunichlamydia sp. REUL1 TaxID=3064277 RepID=UPI00293150DC|nr:RHS repeat-associated core domain-containing protein [Candidatus Neptunochlamydia sp. REUL1]
MKKFYLLAFGLLFSLSLFADYAYDINGNISKAYIPGNGEICYKYDPIGRLAEARHPNNKKFFYSYDFNSRLTAIEGPLGATTFSHTLLNQVDRVKLPFGKEIAYQYNVSGQLTQMTYPDGETIDYKYDASGRLMQMKDSSGTTHYEYDDATNLILKETLPNETSTSYVYDTSFNISEVLHQHQERLIAHYHYSYDKGGNCISMEKKTPDHNETTTYEYDLLNRLVLAKSSNGEFERYSYDALGNRLTKETASETICYVYDSHNRLIQEGNTRYEYDSVGNLVQKNSPGKKVFYSYDPAGKLVSYDDGASQVEFEYDGLGHRVSKTVNGEKTHFINDPISPLSRVLVEITPDGETKKYSYGLSRAAQKTEEGSSYFLYSHPGKSVSHLVNHDGTVTELEYDPFGVPHSGTSQVSYGFNGEERDEETGLIYLRHRYYDPAIGRFISPDSFLGNLKKTQTLNPYAFALNNPLTYIDPDGLSEIMVPLDLYSNPPGTILPSGEVSLGGHAWVGGIDVNENRFYVGVYPGPDFRPNDNIKSLCDKTVHMRVWIAPEMQSRALRAMYDNNYSLIGNNCVDHVIKALDAVGYPHPHFGLQEDGDVSNPAILCDWISREKHHIHPNFLPREGAILIGDGSSSGSFLGRDTHSSFIDLHFCRPNYGGVLLDKSAEFLTELSEISGVIYDAKTDQMILYGRKNLALPQMDMDDLAVAVRSIYGLGAKGPESPGVSMEPGYKNPKKQTGGRMAVTYFGETENTRFGQVMFEADRVLKVLSLGRDNVTGKTVKSSVPGYKSLQALREEEGNPSTNTYCRLWFVPQRISLAESPDGNSMAFSEARMEILTESTLMKKGFIDDRAAERFAYHFTKYYDHFSQEYPILTELKRLGKITAVVKWICEKNLPFDLSFFRSYTPNYFKTPKYSPIAANMSEGQYLVGGVAYTLNEENYFIRKNAQMDQIKEEILRERPDDTASSWDFGNGMTAVASQAGKSLKVGGVRKTFVDFFYPGESIPLSFVRTYSSFNDENGLFGRGWDNVPAKIHFNHALTPFSFSNGASLNLYPQVITRMEGIESIYSLSGLNQEQQPLYKREGSDSYILQDSQNNFLWHRQNETLTFDSQGTLIYFLDHHGNGLTYHYENTQLLEISHSSGQSLVLEYVGALLTSISGPGGKTLFYDYDSKGQLQDVRDNGGNLSSYDYDENNRLSLIYNGLGNKVFEAKYDKYHRATQQTIGNQLITQDFNLNDRSAGFTSTFSSYTHHFDSQYRPQLIKDTLGRDIQVTYGQGNGPQKIVTSGGLEVDYEYDASGRVSKIASPYEGTQHFSYNSRGQLTQKIDGEGIKSVYEYDSLGRLIALYRPFVLSSIAISNGQSLIEGNPKYLTTYTYQDGSNLLESITFPDGQTETYIYNHQELPTQIELPNGIIVTREYDTRHRLIKAKAQGKTIQYEYDNRDHITKISSQGETICFNYDTGGNLTSYIDSSLRKTHYFYDSLSRLVQTIDPTQEIATYEYGLSGLSKMNLPNGSTREIFYDEYHRPTSVR